MNFVPRGYRAGRVRVALLLVVVGSLTAVFVPGGNSSPLALGRPGADAAALRALRPAQQKGRIVVYGLNKPLPAGSRVSQAGGGKNLTRGTRLKRAAWLFWEDLAHGALFEHASVELLIDAQTGKVIEEKPFGWYPLVNGKPPAFLGSDSRVAQYQIYSNLPVRKIHATRKVHARFVSARAAFRAAADGTFANDCAFLVGDRTGDPLSLEAFGHSLAAVGAFTTSHGISTENAASAYDLQLKIRAAVDPNGTKKCKDVLIFLAGHGSPAENTPFPGNPQVTVPGTAEPTVWLDTLGGAKITSRDLRSILIEHPGITFKIMVISCFSGRFVTMLQDRPNLAVISTSSSRTQPSWGYVSAGHSGGFDVTTGPIVENPVNDPLHLPGYVFGMVRGLEAILTSPADVKNTGGSLAQMISLAALRGIAGDFSRQLGWVTPQVYAAPVPKPAPPTTTTTPVAGTFTIMLLPPSFGAGSITTRICGGLMVIEYGINVLPIGTLTLTGPNGYNMTSTLTFTQSGTGYGAGFSFIADTFGTYTQTANIKITGMEKQQMRVDTLNAANNTPPSGACAGP